MPKLDELKFVRIVVPDLFAIIPRYLFKQIKEIDERQIDAIYENAINIMTVPVMNEKGVVVGNLPKLNVWIAVLYDKAHQIKGFLWAEFDVIDMCIFIQATAWDPEYQSSNGAIMKMGIDYLRSLPLPEEMKANIQMATIKPKAFERRGWKRSKKTLMEYKDEPDDELNKTGKQSVPNRNVGGKAKPEVQ